MVGLVFLLGAILGFDAGQLCLPTALIVVGVWLLLRPRLTGPDTALQGTLFGPVRREAPGSSALKRSGCLSVTSGLI